MKNGNRESTERPNWNGSKILSQPLSLETISQSFNLLVVDDNQINLKVITRMMQKIGARITTAGNGREAIEKMIETPFDVVLMDIHMPVLCGVEAIKRIRSGVAGVSNPDLPIIAVSSDTSLQQKRGFLPLGFDDFIEKPINMEVLHRSVITVLANRCGKISAPS